MTSSTRNALANETSPYLLQHADNPVDWHPWGEEALELARASGKPVLLSIGYSACHWCHVMAHESFEDEDTAGIMNQHFVNIKVDREERPDLDKIYQLSHQILTQRAGGWPLTMFLTPDDLTPFFGGTYFPPSPRHGMPAFKDLLMRVVDFLGTHRADIAAQNTSLREALARAEIGEPGAAPGAMDEAPLNAARQQLEGVFDTANGGFGSAPKFPHPTNIERLMRHFAASRLRGTPDARALHIATFTLRRMALGGIYDHVGGGFSRYSVDAEWMIPHFEKMLYDNAPLLAQYAQAWQLTGEPLFAEVANGTADWLMREMQSPEGGYYSSLDADSEGVEGKFYLWSPDAVRPLLDDAEFEALALVYGLDRAPNFEDRHWHLHTFCEPSEAARQLSVSESSLQARLRAARGKLLAARAPRIRPGRDDKVLTSWNALMIKAMASAGQILERPDMIASAERALAFVVERMWVDARLLATYKDGRAHLSAYLDDHAFLIDALLGMLELRWRGEDLELALTLADTLLERFEDPEDGGFYFTADDHERLMHRSKSFMDDALPAGNGVAAATLARLGHLVGEVRYLEGAERAIAAAWPALVRYPHAHNAMLNALEEYLEPPQTIVLRGGSELLERWRTRALVGYSPGRQVVAVPSDATRLPGLLAERVARGETTAYVCAGTRCEAPVSEYSAFETVVHLSEIPRHGAYPAPRQ